MDGIMTKWPAEKGGSSVVDMTTLDTVSWNCRRSCGCSRRPTAWPSPSRPPRSIRTGPSRRPSGHQTYAFDEGQPRLPDALLHDVDSLLHGDGTAKTTVDATLKTEASSHSGLTDMALQDLIRRPHTACVDEDGNPMEEVELLSTSWSSTRWSPATTPMAQRHPGQSTSPRCGQGAAAPDAHRECLERHREARHRACRRDGPDDAEMLERLQRARRGREWHLQRQLEIPPGMETGVPGMEMAQMPQMPMGPQLAAADHRHAA